MEFVMRNTHSENISDRIAFYCVAAVMGLMPVLFYPGFIDAFNLPKAVMLRTLVAFALATLAVAAFGRKYMTVNSRVVWFPAVICFGAVAASCIFSINPFHSFWGQHMFHIDGMLDVAGFMALFVLCAGFLSDRSLRILPRMTVAGSIPVVIYGLAQAAVNDPVAWQTAAGARIWASLGNANFLAGYLILTSTLAVGFWFNEKGFTRLLAAFAACGGLACLLLSASRSGFIGLTVAVAVFCALLLQGRRRLITVLLVLLLAAGSLVAAVMMNARNTGDIEPISRNATPLHRFAQRIDLSDPSMKARLSYAAAAWRMFSERPVLGFGPDTFTLVWRRYMSVADAASTGNRLANPAYAHSEFLNVLATGGIVGASAYGIFWLGLLTAGFRAVAKAAHEHDRHARILAAITAGCAGILAANQFSFHSPASAALVWGYAAVLVRARGKGLDKNITFGQAPSLLLALVMIVLSAAFTLQASASWRAESHFPKGLQYEAKGMYDQAIAEYRMAVNINAAEQTYYQNLAKAYLTRAEKTASVPLRDKDISSAIELYRQHLKLVPQDALSWNGLGIAFLQSGSAAVIPAAQEAFRHAIVEAPAFLEPHINLGTIAFGEGKADEAFGWYEKARLIEPREPLIYFNMGNMYAQKGNMDKAMKCWYDALDVEPSYRAAQVNIEQYLATMGKK